MKIKTKCLVGFFIACVFCSSTLFATRIGIKYKEVDYIIATTIPVRETDESTFSGYYDAFCAVKESRQLYEMHSIITDKEFLKDGTKEIDKAAKISYVNAFIDFMENYSYGSQGKFKDVFAVYDQLIKAPISYKNSNLISEFGAYRFYMINL